MAAPQEASDSLYARMSSIFVPHPKFLDVLEEVRQAISLEAQDGELPCLHVGGPSGAGKTTLLKKLATEFPVSPDARRVPHPTLPEGRANAVPVLITRMPDQPTVISVAQQILKSYGDPNWHRGGRTSLERRIDLYIEACGTRCIVIDEAQRAVDRNGTVVKADLAEWFKTRHDEMKIVFVFVGLARLSHLFERDAQNDRRWDAETRLPSYQWLNADGSDCIEDQDDFIGVVASFKRVSPLPFSPDLDVEQDNEDAALDAAKRFYYASQGLVGLLKKLLKTAMRIAMLDPGRYLQIDLILLSAAFEKAFRYQQKGMINPFGSTWQGQLPPPLQDDSQLINPPRRTTSRPNTRNEMKRKVVESLTKRR